MSSARITALEAEVAGLRKALVSRTVIGQATGLIAARKPCTPQQAFQLLLDADLDLVLHAADGTEGPARHFRKIVEESVVGLHLRFACRYRWLHL